MSIVGVVSGVLAMLLQVVQLFDSWAHHLSPAQFREFSLPYAQRIIAEVKVVHPNTPLIFHANGGAASHTRGCRHCASVLLDRQYGSAL